MVRSRSACFVTAAAALGLLMVTTPSVMVNAQSADSSICTTAKCIANGDAECNRATATCPPCMYTISGGYSCYDKANGKCPFDDVLLTCPPKASPTPSPTPSPTVKPATVPPTAAPATAAPATDSPATVVPPQIDTPPATTVVSSATSPPVTTTPAPAPAAGSGSSSGGQATGASHPNSIQNNPTSSSNSISDSASSKTSGTSSSTSTTTSGPSATDRSASTSDSSSKKVSTPEPSPSAQVMDASNGISSKKSSSLYVNIGVIVAAVAGIAIVAIFIVRRMKRQRDTGLLKTPEEGQKQFNLQVNRSTPGNGARGAGAGAGAVAAGAGANGVGFAVVGGGINGVAAPNRGHRVNSSDAQSLLSMASLNSSTVEFANQHPPYGLPSQFGLPSEASSYARGSSVSCASSTASSAITGGGGGFAQAARAPPPPRPQAIQEGDEFTLHSKRKQSVGAAGTTAVTPGGKSTARPVHKPIYHESVRRVSSAISGNTYEDEYDIVHPRALQDADRRNTETLVMDGRFQSNFSEQDVRSVREDRFFATKEHEI